jgi:alpha-L-arabinofuranosidase
VAYSRNGQPASLYGLNGAASLKERRLVLTVTHPRLDGPCETEVTVRGASVRAVRAATLGGGDVHAHNTFASPREVEPRESDVDAVGSGSVRYSFPPASVTRLTIELG